MKPNYDFEKDLKQGMHLIFFLEFNLKIPLRSNLDEMLLDFLTIREKMIQPLPRQVFINPELEIKLSSHPKRKEIEHIKKLLIDGGNVNFFQSKRLFQTKFHDHLLSEWKIFHFHLSTQLEKDKRFMKSTNTLLFVYIDDRVAILLETDQHTHGIFADKKWLEILDKHFPHILEPFLETTIRDLSYHPNSQERQLLWDKGFTLGLTKINEKLYWSKGIGRATTGHSFWVTSTTLKISRWLKGLQVLFDNHVIDICKKFELNPSIASFKLRFGQTTIEVVETASNTFVLGYPDLFVFSPDHSD